MEISSAIIQAGGRALVASRGGRLTDDIQKAGGEVLLLPVHSKNPATIWRNVGRLEKIVRDHHVELIHARSRAPAWSALAAAKRSQVPLVTTFHGSVEKSSPIKRWYNSSLVRGDCTIANSQFTARAIVAVYGDKTHQLRVIPRGADLAIFDPAKVDTGRINQLLSSWGSVPKDGFRILLAGRLTKWKGHELAIEALAKLKSRASASNRANFSLVFCGGAHEKSDFAKRLRAGIVERGVQEMVHLVGDCADMPAAYSWCDLVISPSVKPEPFGRVVVEAAAMGKPVVAAAHGGAVETVVDGETGILFEPNNVEALAEAIDRMASVDSVSRNAMGERARLRATSLFSASAMCEATLKIYDDVIIGKGA